MKVFNFIKNKPRFVKIDEWEPTPEEEIIKTTKNWIIIPVSQIYNLTNTDRNTDVFNHFNVSAKKCYNKPDMREHFVKYLNYFINFYDKDRELILIYSRIKCLLDCYPQQYTKEAFMYDLTKYILSDTIIYKLHLMNEDNYSLNIDGNKKKRKNVLDPVLQYTDKHAKILYLISMIMIVYIPIVSHFIYKKSVESVNEILIEVFDKVVRLFDVDIVSKLYETCLSNIMKGKEANPIWEKQEIRGTNINLHAEETLYNIILNIIPKYVYDKNNIVFNYVSIKQNIGYKITDIDYEMVFINLSSSKRDEDYNSEFDKFENSLTKENEALYIQNKVNCSETMKALCAKNYIDQLEIDFYINELTVNNIFTINTFQKDLIFNLFYSRFGDTLSIKSINRDDYIKLMIIAKRKLLYHNLVLLPYIISSKILKLNPRRSLNKKEQLRLEGSALYLKIKNKYKSEKIIKYILFIIATIITSNFQIIDYYDKELHGKYIETVSELLCEEILIYVDLVEGVDWENR